MAPKFKTYRDLAEYIDRRGVRRIAVARVMGITSDALSRQLNPPLDEEGTPSRAFVTRVMDALDTLSRGLPTEGGTK